MANEGRRKNLTREGSAGPASSRTGTGPDGAADGRLTPKPPGYFEGESMTRRRLFTGGAVALGGIASAAIGLPAIGFALGPVFEEEEVDYQDAGAPGDFTATGY